MKTLFLIRHAKSSWDDTALRRRRHGGVTAGMISGQMALTWLRWRPRRFAYLRRDSRRRTSRCPHRAPRWLRL